MSIVNALLRPVFDALLYPFRELPPWVGLVVASVVTAVAMLWVFKLTSNQAGIAAVKRRIHACLFEIRLFNDDFRAILRAQVEILRHNLTYLRYSIAPLLWMIVPLVLVVGQLNFHYAYSGLTPGESALVKVRLAGGDDDDDPLAPKPDVRINVPDGLRVETPAVWAPSLREMTWRIGVDRPGDYELRVEVDGQSFTKEVRVTSAVVRRSPLRPAAGFLDELLYPAESPLPADAPIEGIDLGYPDRGVLLFGWDLHWMIFYFVLSIVFAFLLRKPFKVEL